MSASLDFLNNQQEVEVEKQPQPEQQAFCPVSGCTVTVDIIIESSDGKLFGAHSENLARYSGGFPPASFVASSPDSDSESTETLRDPVELPERALVVKYMLSYMHNHRPAMLNGLSSTDVSDIASAAEKYFIYALVEVCRLYMYRLLKDNPMTVLAYAAKHGYDDLFDEAVPKSLGRSLEDMYGYLGATAYFVAWVRYRERFLLVRDCFRSNPPAIKHKGGLNECELWPQFVACLLRMEISQVFEWETVMNNLADTILEDCDKCSQRAANWVSRIYGSVDIRVKPSSLKK